MRHTFTYELCDSISIDIGYRGFQDEGEVTIFVDSVLYEGIDILAIIDCLDAFVMTSIEEQATKHYLDLSEYYSENDM